MLGEGGSKILATRNTRMLFALVPFRSHIMNLRGWGLRRNRWNIFTIRSSPSSSSSVTSFSSSLSVENFACKSSQRYDLWSIHLRRWKTCNRKENIKYFCTFFWVTSVRVKLWCSFVILASVQLLLLVTKLWFCSLRWTFQGTLRETSLSFFF